MTRTIGEFDEVGNTVRDFADDDATVVVGTVVDPELEDELRVTVVATGLGDRRVKVKRTPGEPSIRLITGEADSSAPDYREIERRPAVYRKGAAAGGAVASDKSDENDLDYLDIPAFLRRQAD